MFNSTSTASALLIFTSLLFSSLASAAPTPLRSPVLRQMVYTAIDQNIVWGGDLSSDDLGSIWLGEIAETEMTIVKISRDANGYLVYETENSFVCGTEFDESELSGSCHVELTQGNHWSVTRVMDCICEG